MNANEPIYNYEYSLTNALKLLDSSSVISEQDKQLLRGFIDHLKSQGISTGRLAKYLYHLRRGVEKLGIGAREAKREDIERLVTWLRQDTNYTPHTVSDYLFALKRFFKFVKYGNVDKETPWPEEVRWLRSATKPSERKQPEFLISQEVEEMIKATTSLRDKAMLAVGFEAGLRATELLSLNVGSIMFDDRGARLRVEKGKTGSRTVRLISSVKLLSQYLQTHSFRHDVYAPLWLTESNNYANHRLSWVRWNRRLKQLAKQAGIKKRIFNHMLRHGSATRNAKFLTDSELKLMYGWSMSSKMPAVYVHLSGRDLDDKLTSIYGGQKIEQTKPEFAPVICPRCSELASPGMVYCPKCASPLGLEERGRMAAEDESVKKELAELRKLVEKYLASSPTS